MKIVRVSHNKEVYRGILDGDDIRVDTPGEKPVIFSQKDVNFLSPVEPSKIVCVGLNYTDHAEELGMAVPADPVIFIKPSTSIIGHGGTISYPSSSGRVDYEAELGVVIKDYTRKVPASEAFAHIAGYTCVNDVTARDLQSKDVQWTRAKSFDTFAPVGPWIETDLDPADLGIRTYLNGDLKQESRTSRLIFDIPGLIEFISDIMTLLPGDIISTGTPHGVGPMCPGDEVTVEIEGIGRLTNRVEKG
ncbi:MAG: fumarylacetoacetate hydrolase family protein [Candidatus Tantalella remota]|nr:fumarylacetoacetate hydrolase family protein [Candidatus Tantalella remota]